MTTPNWLIIKRFYRLFKNLDTVGVAGSIPVAPIEIIKGTGFPGSLFIGAKWRKAVFPSFLAQNWRRIPGKDRKNFLCPHFSD